MIFRSKNEVFINFLMKKNRKKLRTVLKNSNACLGLCQGYILMTHKFLLHKNNPNYKKSIHTYRYQKQAKTHKNRQ